MLAPIIASRWTGVNPSPYNGAMNDDSLARARAASVKIEAARHAMAEAAAERRAAMQDARATMPVAAIAAELGITRERAYAILAGKE